MGMAEIMDLLDYSAQQWYSAVLRALHLRNFLPPPKIRRKNTVLQCSLLKYFIYIYIWHDRRSV